MHTLALLVLLAAPGDGLVPMPFKMTIMVQPMDKLPEIDGYPSIEKALEFIARMKGSKRLRAADDRDIFRLVSEYRSGKRKLRLVMHAQGIYGNTKNIMGYACSDDEFMYTPLQASPEVTAALVYHELQHIVQCDRLKARLGLRARPIDIDAAWSLDVCRSEEPAYAAQVRFFTAMYDRRRMPKSMSTDPAFGDASMFPRTMGAWEAIYLGRFCEWFVRTTTGLEKNTKQIRLQ